jgi:hypothetical protein
MGISGYSIGIIKSSRILCEIAQKGTQLGRSGPQRDNREFFFVSSRYPDDGSTNDRSHDLCNRGSGAWYSCEPPFERRGGFCVRKHKIDLRKISSNDCVLRYVIWGGKHVREHPLVFQLVLESAVSAVSRR